MSASATAYRERLLVQASRLRRAMEVAAGALDDVTASRVVEMYPPLTGDGSLVPAGARVRWDGGLKRAAVDLWDRRAYWPDGSPDLWEDVAYHDGVRVIPQVFTAGLAFAKGELGWWAVDGLVYACLADGCVWGPIEAPACWQAVAV